MYAVIKTGGKQYTVKKDDVLAIERLTGEKGDKIKFDSVRLVGGSKELKMGHPFVEGASVDAKIEDQTRGKKLVVYKKKRRKGYEVRRGHRQDLTNIKITGINT